MPAEKLPLLDFDNTEIAFGAKSDAELKRTHWLFRMMNNAALVRIGSKMTMLALSLRLPIEGLVKKTVFRQFCGGATLLETQATILSLAQKGVLSILDYGSEGKETEKDFDKTMNETLRALQFAAQCGTAPVVSTKLTGMMRFALLEKLDRQEQLLPEEQQEYQNALKRIDSICHNARELGMSLYIDAEESWIQEAIDDLVKQMMLRYNREKAVVFSTFQMYRHDRLILLNNWIAEAKKDGYLLGAKVVRGAYMEKERRRAQELGYPSPIQPDKAASDRDYDAAVALCVEHIAQVSLCLASHNRESTLLLTQLMADKGLAKNHPHLMFSQLYGMSDNITFNLAKAGYNVGKYLPYGPVREVLPYLIRRAQENSSVTGDMSREFALLDEEVRRRKQQA